MVDDPGDTTIIERRARYGFMFAMTALVIITGLVALRSGFGPLEVTGLAVVWVILGYASYFSATQAYGTRRLGERPYLVLGRSAPAWAFFLAGSGLLLAIALWWTSLGQPKTGVLLAGIAVMYACVTFPRPLTPRRAALIGIGLFISAIAIVFV